MQKIMLKTSSSSSEIIIGSNLNFQINKDIRAYIITDKNLYDLYFNSIAQYDHYVLTPGEKSKNLANAEKIYKELLNFNFSKKDILIGLGGGVITDITGFISATYKRGTGLNLIPTSLMAMADAAIGGKNGINYKNLKNSIGTIKQPEKIICDLNYLDTLPDKEYKSGLAEIIKTAIIGNKNLFYFIYDNAASIKARNKDILEKLIASVINIKAAIVEKDEDDSGIRKFLNFGHTIGHAVESSNKFHNISHGEAVSIGMTCSVLTSVMRSYLSIKDMEDITKMLTYFDLPVDFNIQRNKVVNFIKNDKKSNLGKVDFIMLKGIGEPFIKTLTISEIMELIDDLP